MDRETIVRGDNTPITLIFKEDGVVVDITNYTPKLCAKTKLSATSYIFNKECTKSDPTNGVATVTIDEDDSATVVKNALCEALLVDQAGNELTYHRFLLDIVDDVHDT